MRALDYYDRNRRRSPAGRAVTRIRAGQRTVQADGLTLAMVAVTPAADTLAATVGRPVLAALVDRHAGAVEEYLRLTAAGVNAATAAVLAAHHRKAG